MFRGRRGGRVEWGSACKTGQTASLLGHNCHFLYIVVVVFLLIF